MKKRGRPKMNAVPEELEMTTKTQLAAARGRLREMEIKLKGLRGSDESVSRKEIKDLCREMQLLSQQIGESERSRKFAHVRLCILRSNFRGLNARVRDGIHVHYTYDSEPIWKIGIRDRLNPQSYLDLSTVCSKIKMLDKRYYDRWSLKWLKEPVSGLNHKLQEVSKAIDEALEFERLYSGRTGRLICLKRNNVHQCCAIVDAIDSMLEQLPFHHIWHGIEERKSQCLQDLLAQLDSLKVRGYSSGTEQIQELERLMEEARVLLRPLKDVLLELFGIAKPTTS